MNNSALFEFIRLLEAGKKAALDVHLSNGEIACRYTKSINGESGNGTPPEPMSDRWQRVFECSEGKVRSIMRGI